MPASALLSDARSLVADGAGARSALVLPPAPGSLAPFEVHVPQGAIDDWHLRLSLVRWPDRETVSDCSQGVPLSAAKSPVDYGLHDYDWQKFEARLDRFPQFRTRIDCVGIHFIHARSPHPQALPIIFTHGWLSSVAEFLDVIDRLTDPTRYDSAGAPRMRSTWLCLPSLATVSPTNEPGWNPGASRAPGRS